MKEGTLMRIDKKLLKKLASIRLTKRESYAEVVERLIKNRRIK